MYIPYIMKRTQIYLTEDQDRKLALKARASGSTKSFEIREAISRYLADEPPDSARLTAFRQVVREVAGVAPELPPGSDYVEEIRQSGAERLREINERQR